MHDILAKMDGGELIGFVAVVMGCLTGMVGIVGGVWFNARKVEAEIALKRELVAGGMPAEDVERVVSATAGAKPQRPRLEKRAY